MNWRVPQRAEPIGAPSPLEKQTLTESVLWPLNYPDTFARLGVQPPQPDWGVMVAEGQSGVLQGYPAESLAAGLCIMIVVVAVNLLGERLNDRAASGR